MNVIDEAVDSLQFRAEHLRVVKVVVRFSGSRLYFK